MPVINNHIRLIVAVVFSLVVLSSPGLVQHELLTTEELVEIFSERVFDQKDDGEVVAFHSTGLDDSGRARLMKLTELET